MWRLLLAWFHLRELETVHYGHVHMDTSLGMPDQLTLNLCCAEQNHPCRGGLDGKISSLIHHNNDECQFRRWNGLIRIYWKFSPEHFVCFGVNWLSLAHPYPLALVCEACSKKLCWATKPGVRQTEWLPVPARMHLASVVFCSVVHGVFFETLQFFRSVARWLLRIACQTLKQLEQSFHTETLLLNHYTFYINQLNRVRCAGLVTNSFSVSKITAVSDRSRWATCRLRWGFLYGKNPSKAVMPTIQFSIFTATKKSTLVKVIMFCLILAKIPKPHQESVMTYLSCGVRIKTSLLLEVIILF